MRLGKLLLWFTLALPMSACTGADGVTGNSGAVGPAGSTGAKGTDGKAGLDGTNGVDGKDGAKGGDGAKGSDGAKGADGAKGDKGDKGDPGTAGGAGGAGQTGPVGQPGLNAGETPGLVVNVDISAPANAQFFAAGEAPVITITLEDAHGLPVAVADLSQARLLVAGPQNQAQTKSAIKLMNVSGDYAQAEHHFVNLTNNANVKVNGNVLEYDLSAVTDEAAGTYVVGVWGVSKAHPLDQVFPIKEIQIGTATAEKQIVGHCDDCHKGGANGVTYMAHTQVGFSPVGNPSLDSQAIEGCKGCHNQAGYAAFCGVPGANPCNAADKKTDSIVRRVHGVHHGDKLKNPFNIDPVTGDFRAFTDVAFPAGASNCAKCHTDDAWKTNPTTAACTACHDNLNLAAGTISPPRVLGKPSAATCATPGNCATPSVSSNCLIDSACKADWPNVTAKAVCDVTVGSATLGQCVLGSHIGGKQADDKSCANCHSEGGMSDTVGVHAPAPVDAPGMVELAVSAPGNGKYFVAGEKPAIKITVKDANAKIVDPATFTAASWNSINFYVAGPRSRFAPVLSTAAKGPAGLRAFAPYQPPYGPVLAKYGPYDLTAVTGFTVTIDGAPVTVDTTGCTFKVKTAATTAEIATCLNANAAFKAVATAKSASTSYSGAAKTYLQIYGGKRGGSVQFLAPLAGDLNNVLSIPVGTYAPIETRSSFANALAIQADPLDEDPAVTRTVGANGFMTYALGDVAALKAGTYIAYIEARPLVGARGVARVAFQVGSATEDKPIATNCLKCHENTRMHGARIFDVDVCMQCHDNQRQLKYVAGSIQNPTLWTYTGKPTGLANQGFGYPPMVRIAHGYHFGAHLNHPEQNVNTPKIVFPQDIRNCQTCHSETDDWKKAPSRLACLSCHDSDAAQAHGTLNTLDPTPAEPWSGDETESCGSCHGDGKEFSAENLHNITTPYKPPYPRE